MRGGGGGNSRWGHQLLCIACTAAAIVLVRAQGTFTDLTDSTAASTTGGDGASLTSPLPSASAPAAEDEEADPPNAAELEPSADASSFVAATTETIFSPPATQSAAEVTAGSDAPTQTTRAVATTQVAPPDADAAGGAGERAATTRVVLPLATEAGHAQDALATRLASGEPAPSPVHSGGGAPTSPSTPTPSVIPSVEVAIRKVTVAGAEAPPGGDARTATSPLGSFLEPTSSAVAVATASSSTTEDARPAAAEENPVVLFDNVREDADAVESTVATSTSDPEPPAAVADPTRETTPGKGVATATTDAEPIAQQSAPPSSSQMPPSPEFSPSFALAPFPSQISPTELSPSSSHVPSSELAPSSSLMPSPSQEVSSNQATSISTLSTSPAATTSSSIESSSSAKKISILFPLNATRFTVKPTTDVVAATATDSPGVVTASQITSTVSSRAVAVTSSTVPTSASASTAKVEDATIDARASVTTAAAVATATTTVDVMDGVASTSSDTGTTALGGNTTSEYDNVTVIGEGRFNVTADGDVADGGNVTAGYATTSRTKTVRIVIYVCVGSLLGALLMVAIVGLIVSSCRSNHQQSFTLKDTPHLNFTNEDFTLTQIPRPKTILTTQNEVSGSALKQKNGEPMSNSSTERLTEGKSGGENGHHRNGAMPRQKGGIDNPGFKPDQVEMVENKSGVYIPDADYDIVATAKGDSDSDALQVSF
ncbi:PREDICTED: mucin-5AC-like isoform X1 [Priapulus caudatus]|uniref:Mucin-5AC-like isoform X1 n=1 Tax=Priapulus caudatus TaxID=37621 RepID=A0ABM1EJA8_PRICU|nr:PREDICTED: mucin-5AC-like isoform X1 [Priapulus caudatus]XP_014672279.1 PREDICTED: mucin-5AC-like isoform X1 [Priapulus caudatus]XP_014672280.1 PREDICTED: mucin-5AC-like isoform X1 [Priapulus caudatus]XP_014672281.1 PREDICTED: mucin-5AC-like isoform X1 [Priapulus caudatus]